MDRYGCILAGIALCLPLTAWSQEETYRLTEKLEVGSRYHVRMRVEINGRLQPPAVKGKQAPSVTIEGTSNNDYDERVLSVQSDGQVNKTLRYHDRLEFHRKIAGQPQELVLRPAVKRLVILRKGHSEVPFSPDGPLTWGEMDAVRTDVFTPALQGLLPRQAVKVGDKWTATSATVEELTDLEKIEDGELECKFDRIVSIGKRQIARVTFTGSIRGISEDGPARHRLQGHYHFDLDSHLLADVTLLGTTNLIDPEGKASGQIEGRLVLTRSLNLQSREVDDDAVRSLVTEPNAQNTEMLYDNKDLGVRFIHSRRWRIAQVMGSQVALATNDGSGILVTLDPLEKIPTAQGFLEESRGWLTKQKAKLLKTYSARRLRDRPTLDAFAMEAQLNNQEVWLDYYITAQELGGATIAARLLKDDLTELRKETDRLAKTLTVTRRIQLAPAKK